MVGGVWLLLFVVGVVIVVIVVLRMDRKGEDGQQQQLADRATATATVATATATGVSLHAFMRRLSQVQLDHRTHPRWSSRHTRARNRTGGRHSVSVGNRHPTMRQCHPTMLVCVTRRDELSAPAR